MKKLIKAFAIVIMVLTCGVCVGSAVGTMQTKSAYALVLKQGNTGETVRTVQRKLKNWGYYSGSVDGIFGSQTKKAVRLFQQKNGQGCFRRADDAQHAQCLLHTIHRLQCRKYCSSLQTIFEHPVWQIADLAPMAHGKAFPEEKVLTAQADPKDESHLGHFLDDAQHMRRFRQARPWLRVVLLPKRS